MKTEGFETAVVVETSPNKFQACLKHDLVLRRGDKHAGCEAARRVLVEIRSASGRDTRRAPLIRCSHTCAAPSTVVCAFSRCSMVGARNSDWSSRRRLRQANLQWPRAA